MEAYTLGGKELLEQSHKEMFNFTNILFFKKLYVYPVVYNIIFLERGEYFVSVCERRTGKKFGNFSKTYQALQHFS